ncbi:hypothetical protein BJ166DRAFT_336315 [Pestalotiopsis sp. NC0098]|nr:hypothetical protein BJ166DRAFT_336315 [Pestalotiopsis sp. NC0098]
MEEALEAFAIEIKLAKSQAPLNVIAPGTIVEMSETALRSAFMSEGSEAVYLRSSSPKTFMHAKDIEYLKPGGYVSDSIIDLTLKMVKRDQYYIVESAAFERILFERDTAFWDDNDKDAQMGYIIPMHIDLAHDDESDNDDADTDTEKDADKDTHGFNHKNGHLSHHFVLVYIITVAGSGLCGPDIRLSGRTRAEPQSQESHRKDSSKWSERQLYVSSSPTTKGFPQLWSLCHIA